MAVGITHDFLVIDTEVVNRLNEKVLDNDPKDLTFKLVYLRPKKSGFGRCMQLDQK